MVFWIENINFNFTIFTLLWATFDTLYLLVTSKLTLDSLLKVNQNQVFFPMVPKFLHFEKNPTFYYDVMATWTSSNYKNGCLGI